MNAIEFVKKYGWGEFKDLYQASLYVDPFQPTSEKIIGIKKSEIKELFDAFELVESYGGYEEVKWQTVNKIMYINNQEHDLVKAIYLVEQCQ